MKKNYSLRHLFMAFLCGSIFFSGVSFAANSASSIEVNFLPLKYFFDGTEKLAPKAQQGFVYNGTTYVPLRFIAEALGKEVGWDGKTSSIFVGEQPEGTAVHLDSLEPHTTKDGFNPFKDSQQLETNMNEKYLRSFVFYGCGGWSGCAVVFTEQNAEYLTNAQYEKFEVLLAPEVFWKGQPKEENIGWLKVYADDEIVYDSGNIASDITSPIKVNADISGALRIKVEVYGKKLALIDPKLIH
ncbi:stalk domain-containing protein [Paenibacillus sp. TRM 82003]|nr:stalk domain-containing protein [Paenibacillus sp. TRM 82003]